MSQTTDGDTTEYEVGVRGGGNRTEHIIVNADTPEDASDKAVRKARKSVRYDLADPVEAYQAYDVDNMETHNL